MDSASTSIVINFDTATEPAEPRDIELLVVDYCTEAVLPDAVVVISGPNGYSYTGTASGTGIVSLPGLYPGEYTIKTTKAGYLDSDLDAIANDRFTV